jgi:hypothetical protein
MNLEFSKAELPQFEDLEFLGDNYVRLSEGPFGVLDIEGVCRLGDLEYQTTFPKKAESGEILPVLSISTITEIQPGDIMKPGDVFIAKGLPLIILRNGKIMVTSSIGSFSIGDDGKDGDGWNHYLYKGSNLQEIIDGWFNFFFND